MESNILKMGLTLDLFKHLDSMSSGFLRRGFRLSSIPTNHNTQDGHTQTHTHTNVSFRSGTIPRCVCRSRLRLRLFYVFVFVFTHKPAKVLRP